MEKTVCRLCLRPTEEVGNLCKSHIIPKFMLKYSKDRGTGRATIYKGKNKQPIEGQFDLKEKMLCAGCELKVKHYEDFMQETFFLHRKHGVLSDTPVATSYFGSNDLMSLGLLSIFWRATHADLPEFRWALVPDYISSEIGSWILNRSIPRLWQNLVNVDLLRIVGSNGEAISFLMTPQVRQHETKYEYVFAFAGFLVIFTIPPVAAPSSRKFSLRHGSRIIRAKKIHYRQIPEIAFFFE